MSYTKTIWQDHVLTRPHTYTETVNSDGTKTLTPAGDVEQQGTPVNAENLNHMEQGIENAHTAVSDLSAATDMALGGKQDKESGKGLSSNDFTNAYKGKLDNLDTEIREGSDNIPTSDAVFQALQGAGDSPYIYLTKAEYELITPVADQLYWVTNTNGKHGVYLNGSLVEGTNVFLTVFGVTWAGGEPSAMTRTDDAADFSDPVPALGGTGGSSPFDNVMPWEGMEEVTIGGNVLIKIPKFWYKVTKNGSSMTFQIANAATEGFHVSPAHADRGDGAGERDYVYIGKYKCSSSNWKSVSGASPKVNITRSAARTGITGLGAGYYMQDFAMFWTTRLLYLVEFADWNSQSKIGYGCGNNSSVQNTGTADGMTYHTGTMQSSRTTYGAGIKYRGIEDPWGNVFEWCDGIRFSSSTVYAYNKPSEYSDTTGGTNVGSRPTTSGVPTAFNMPSATGYEWAMYPSAQVSDSTYSKYVADYCYYYSSGVVLFVGGSYYQNQGCGMFYLDGNYGADYSSGSIGVRLQYLP